MLRLLALLAAAAALELTPANWAEKTDGKAVFIKFLAPWWGHCKQMKPAWDSLMESYADSPTALVADVDCTAAGEKLCSEHGVRGYPTIKYGDPADLQDYNGGRSADDLKEFAEKNLTPLCSIANIDLCSDAKKAQLKKFVKMDIDELEETITEMETKITAEEDKFTKKQKDAEAMVKKAEKAKEKAIKKIKDDGLGAMKSAKAYKEKTGKSEL